MMAHAFLCCISFVELSNKWGVKGLNRLELLDYGRFFAALFVVVFHYTFNGITNGKIESLDYIPSIIEFTKYGYLGVELFFMISGYVIFFSAKNRTASKFAVSRAVRLYPTYWFAVLFTSFFAINWGGDLMSVTPKQIIANLTMLHSFVGVSHVDGVYWTLLNEIIFYVAVFLILLLGFQKHLKPLFVYWPVLFVIAMLFNVQSLPLLGNYYYYFSAGALFAIIKDKPSPLPFISLSVVYCFCINFSTSRAFQLTEETGVAHSAISIGIIVTIFFMLFIFQNTKKGQTLKLPMSKTAGALTYPLYLIHAHFGYILINMLATNENKVTIYFVTVSVIILIAYFIHKVIEVRLSNIWKMLFQSTLGLFVEFIQEKCTPIKFIGRNNTKVETRKPL
jgi:peptidoglycan/LPS O-acetylase OafA/YrhL